MPLIEALSLGQYSPGDTPLHKLSATLKLLALPACVIASFSLGSPLQLALLALCGASLAIMAGQGMRILRTGLWQLRYLLLVTVLLHGVLSPGRTLFGLSWLSLDGLLFGMRTAGQLALAVTFSSLLTLTTRPDELVRSLDRMLSAIGLPRAWAREVFLFLSLVLYFIPVLREEALAVADRGCAGQGEEQKRRTLVDRARSVAGMVEPLLFSLVDRADLLAKRLAGGEPLFDERQVRFPERYPRRVQLLAGFLFAALIALVAGVCP